uniref:Retrovirus-related Pol polyprotein from transposon 297 n=1 Tax=Ceratitis capitata TaxID=7213 RepID=W8AI48_CERCA
MIPLGAEISYKTNTLNINGQKIKFKNLEENRKKNFNSENKKVNMENHYENIKDLFNEENIKDFYVKESNEYINEILEKVELKVIENIDIFNKLKNDEMNLEENRSLENLINKNKDLFFKEGDELTSVNEIQHNIDTTTDRPIYTKLYRYPEIHKNEIRNQITEMEKNGIIQKSCSPYNAPLWIVPKKMDNSGKQKWRIVIDYRRLNEITIEDKLKTNFLYLI